ncbi:MAG: YHS domain-containing protein [Candidatus Nomurabacteria bacterium]|nr:YHS domain-containing protein [Candidatus Nomurabacteria bacterium]
MENRIKSLIKKLSRLGYHVRPKNNTKIDPVCGMKVSSDLLKTDYQGESYFFCAEHCKEQFDKDPEIYILK